MAAFPWHDSKKSALNRRFSTLRIRDKDVQSQPLICSRIFLPEKSFRITLAAFQSLTHIFFSMICKPVTTVSPRGASKKTEVSKPSVRAYAKILAEPFKEKQRVELRSCTLRGISITQKWSLR